MAGSDLADAVGAVEAQQAQARIVATRPYGHLRRRDDGSRRLTVAQAIASVSTGELVGRTWRRGRTMKLFRLLWRGIDIIMAALLVAMIGLVFTNVVLRYGFSSGLRPSIELSRLGFVWLVLLGAAVVLRREEHLAVSEFTTSFFPRAVPFLRRLAYAVIAVGVLMLFWGAFRQMNANWGNISQLTGLPSALFYLPGVISGALMAVIAVVRIVDPAALREPGDDRHDDVHL